MLTVRRSLTLLSCFKNYTLCPKKVVHQTHGDTLKAWSCARKFRGARHRCVTNCICLRQSRLAGGTMFSTCSSVRPSVCSFVLSSVIKLVNKIIWKRSNRFSIQIGISGPRRKGTKNDQLGSHEVKGQGRTRPQLDLETWRRRHSWLIRSSSFLVQLRLLLRSWSDAIAMNQTAVD